MANETYGDVTEQPIDVVGLLSRVAATGHGAQTVFVGVVRDVHAGRRVLAITYDCFVPLARKVLDEIAAEASARWPGARVAVVHRIGRLEVGEASVGIAVGSPRRAAAYDASRHVIEQIKERAPIWKQEHYGDGASEWLDGRDLKAPR